MIIFQPLFSLLTFYATFKAFSTAKKYFPKTNSNSGVGNAFRHSLWSSLIMMYCCKISSPKKAEEWCRKITNMHEVLFPNDKLDRKMDLHNNKIGIKCFYELLSGIHRQFFETSFIIDCLLEKTKMAQETIDMKDLNEEELVYLKKSV